MSQYPASASPERPADGLAIASLVCGIIALLGSCVYGVGGILAIPGLICGLMSKTKGGIRTAGIVCSAIALGLGLLVFVAVVVLGIAMLGAAAASNPGGTPVAP